MPKTLSSDKDWSIVDGLMCAVTQFTPLALVENGKVISNVKSSPYALVALECLERTCTLPVDTMGSITHALDFKHLWSVFMDRKVAADEAVVIVWSRKKLRGLSKLFPAIMPRMAVMVFNVESLEFIRNRDHRPDLKGLDRFMAERPILHLQPPNW